MFTENFDRFFRTHERVMWQFGAIDFSTLQPELLTPEDLAAVRGAMLVESHNPVYTQRLLEYFRHDHEMTAFVVTWAYEEMKHYAVLRSYLGATGRVDVQDLTRELEVTRAGQWGDEEVGFTPLQSYTYTMLQEEITGLFYKRFAETTREPLLKSILQLIGRDEYRHCQYYLEKGRQELAANRGRIREVDDILLRFQMPGPTFMQGYETHAQAMQRVAKVDIAAMKEILDKVAQLTGRLHLVKLATDRAFHRKLGDEWGVDLPLVLAAVRRG